MRNVSQMLANWADFPETALARSCTFTHSTACRFAHWYLFVKSPTYAHTKGSRLLHQQHHRLAEFHPINIQWIMHILLSMRITYINCITAERADKCIGTPDFPQHSRRRRSCVDIGWIYLTDYGSSHFFTQLVCLVWNAYGFICFVQSDDDDVQNDLK